LQLYCFIVSVEKSENRKNERWQFERKKSNKIKTDNKQESRAVARKPRDAAAVLFGLKFADNIQAFESQPSQLQTYRHKTEFNAKWRFNVIQSHVFWSQWKGDKAIRNTI